MFPRLAEKVARVVCSAAAQPAVRPLTQGPCSTDARSFPPMSRVMTRTSSEGVAFP